MSDLIKKIPLVRLEKKQLYTIFENMLLCSDISLIQFENINCNLKKYTLLIDSVKYEVLVTLKNITECGWKDRKFLRRIQTIPLKNIIPTSRNSCFLLCGLAFYELNPILVSWNATNYIYHNSNRSCYVSLSSIEKAYKNQFYIGLDSNQYVYACNQFSVRRLITEFIHDNYSEGLKW